MKRLVLIRHGKSDWSDGSVRDFDRPLSERGMGDAPRMARYLSELGIFPDLMVTSPARRCRETASAMAEVFAYPLDLLEENPSLYLGCPVALEDAVDFTPPKVHTLFLFAHNPGISRYASAVTGADLELPTCGTVICEGKGRWAGISVTRWDVLTPKKLP